jgi:hypothetical protein
MKLTLGRKRIAIFAGLWLGLVAGWIQPGLGGALVRRGPVDSGQEAPPISTPTDPIRLVPEFEIVPAPSLAPPQSGGTLINGAQGGRVTVGRFTLDIPPGAFHGFATVLIAVPDPHRLQCSLDIVPALESFNAPVKLTVDASGGDLADANDWVLVTWDVKTQSWQKLPGSFGNAGTMAITGWLPHFSMWGVVDSKAGW